ncbi:MAG: hypothetical protein F2694_10475 [Actinobacteria bacterium]|uniref:Unannotated protein n=1 Tax=freshwater metagenome TaxID=449393 RepID=A0A6J6UH87_9ZZZZ|nr:hypothetical protein [Actinomycetota bacterium]
MPSAQGGVSSISPEPTDEEVVAIVAAVQLGLPTSSGQEAALEAVSRWRFSGRWWSRPVPARRARPGG